MIFFSPENSGLEEDLRSGRSQKNIRKVDTLIKF